VAITYFYKANFVKTLMAAAEQPPAGYLSHNWKRLRHSYADSSMLLGSDGNPLTCINAYQGHLALKRLDIRSIDNAEFNELVNTDPEAAKQMRHRAVWTSFLKDVGKSRGSGGYTAKHIARPDVEIKNGYYLVGGTEKAVKLPNDGWFTIRHIMESEDGLPHETTTKPADEPSAYWSVSEGTERPVLRGDWGLHEHRQFHAHVSWESLDSLSHVGARGASDNEIKPIMLAGMDAIREIEKIGKMYGLTPAEVVAELEKRL
jgi:hypothetical protein